jgi:hypothetical protein
MRNGFCIAKEHVNARVLKDCRRPYPSRGMAGGITVKVRAVGTGDFPVLPG